MQNLLPMVNLLQQSLYNKPSCLNHVHTTTTTYMVSNFTLRPNSRFANQCLTIFFYNRRDHVIHFPRPLLVFSKCLTITCTITTTLSPINSPLKGILHQFSQRIFPRLHQNLIAIFSKFDVLRVVISQPLSIKHLRLPSSLLTTFSSSLPYWLLSEII